MAKPRLADATCTHVFRAVHGTDIARRIRVADGVQEAPVYYGVHGVERAHAEAHAAGLDEVMVLGRVWRFVDVGGGLLAWTLRDPRPTRVEAEPQQMTLMVEVPVSVSIPLQGRPHSAGGVG